MATTETALIALEALADRVELDGWVPTKESRVTEARKAMHAVVFDGKEYHPWETAPAALRRSRLLPPTKPAGEGRMACEKAGSEAAAAEVTATYRAGLLRALWSPVGFVSLLWAIAGLPEERTGKTALTALLTLLGKDLVSDERRVGVGR